MGAQVLIKSVMKAKKVKSGALADKLNYKEQAFYNKLSRDTMSAKFLCVVADALDCDVALIDRETGEIYR